MFQALCGALWIIVLWAMWKPESFGFWLGKIGKGFLQSLGPITIDRNVTVERVIERERQPLQPPGPTVN